MLEPGPSAPPWLCPDAPRGRSLCGRRIRGCLDAAPLGHLDFDLGADEGTRLERFEASREKILVAWRSCRLRARENFTTVTARDEWATARRVSAGSPAGR